MIKIQDWYSQYPNSFDDYNNMPQLENFQDLTRVSQIHALRDSIINLEIIVGSDAYESGSIRYRLNNLTFDDIYNNQSGIRTINVNDQPISFYGNKEIRFDGGPIRLSEQGSDPIDIDNYGFIYVKHIDGYSELSYLDNYGNILQISNKGYSTDPNAIHKNIDSEISSITSANPTGLDYLLIEDADDSNNKKSINISDIIPLTTKGDIFTYNSTTWDRLSIGPDGYLLSSDSSESTGLKWIENVSGSDPNAIHKNIANEISLITSANPAGSDYLLIEDADDSNNKKSINISDIIPLTTKGDIFTYNSTTWDKLPIGTSDYILSADSSESTGLKWIENTSGNDPNAIHKNIANEISLITSATPVGSDYLLIEDANDLNNKKSINISDIIPLTTKGDIFTYSTSIDNFSKGLDGQILSVDTSETNGLIWITKQISDGYLYLESRNDPDKKDGYGIIYAKEIDGYSELHYLDDYENGLVTQITSGGRVFSYSGHEEDRPPNSPSSYNEEWLIDGYLNPKWSWSIYGLGEPDEWHIKNKQLVVKTSAYYDGSPLNPDPLPKDGYCLLQEVPSGNSWAIMAKLKLFSYLNGTIDDRMSVSICSINTSDDSVFSIGQYAVTYVYPNEPFRHSGAYVYSFYEDAPSGDNVLFAAQEFPKIIGLYYDHTSHDYLTFFANDFSNDQSSWLPLQTVTSLSGVIPEYFGLSFVPFKSKQALGGCEWFRVLINP